MGVMIFKGVFLWLGGRLRIIRCVTEESRQVKELRIFRNGGGVGGGVEGRMSIPFLMPRIFWPLINFTVDESRGVGIGGQTNY